MINTRRRSISPTGGKTSKELQTNLVEDEALALSRPATHRDNPDGTFDEMQGSDCLRVHLKFALFIAINQAQGSRGPGALLTGNERGSRRTRRSGRATVLGRGRSSPSETEHLHHLLRPPEALGRMGDTPLLGISSDSCTK